MRKIFYCLVMMLLASTFVAADILPGRITDVSAEAMVVPGYDTIQRLYAGQHTDVGYVGMLWDTDELVVDYVIDKTAWWMTEIHFGWDEQPWGYAVPGRLQYKYENMKSQFFQIRIPYDQLPDASCLTFAAHAVVKTSDCNDSEKTIFVEGLQLPDYANFSVFLGGNRGRFRVEIRAEPPLNGNGFSGYCLDKDRHISIGYGYEAVVIHDIDELRNIVANPQNVDMVEWIMLKNYAGREIRCGQIVQSHHVQNAIWYLVDDSLNDVGCVARAIVSEAYRARHTKNVSTNCWGTSAVFALQPIVSYSSAEEPGQPIIVDMIGQIDCPTATPTPTETPTRPPTSTPTPTRTATPTSTPTGTPPPTGTPAPTSTPTSTPTPTYTPTSTPTPPGECGSETAWAYGETEFTQKWGWFFNSCR